MLLSYAFLILFTASYVKSQVDLNGPDLVSDINGRNGDSSPTKFGPEYSLGSQSETLDGNVGPESAPLAERKGQSEEVGGAAKDPVENEGLSEPIASEVSGKSKSPVAQEAEVQENNPVLGEVSDEPVEGKKSKVKVEATPPPCEIPCCHTTCVPMVDPMAKFTALFANMMAPISSATKTGAALPGMLAGKLATGASTLKGQMMSAASNNPLNHYGGVMGSKMTSSSEALLKSATGKIGALNAFFNSLTTPPPPPTSPCVPMVCRPVMCAPPTTTTTTTTTTTPAPTTPKPCQMIYSHARCC